MTIDLTIFCDNHTIIIKLYCFFAHKNRIRPENKFLKAKNLPFESTIYKIMPIKIMLISAILNNTNPNAIFAHNRSSQLAVDFTAHQRFLVGGKQLRHRNYLPARFFQLRHEPLHRFCGRCIILVAKHYRAVKTSVVHGFSTIWSAVALFQSPVSTEHDTSATSFSVFAVSPPPSI